jgi:transcriptional regulator with XRE-family HTH domain
MADDRGRNFGPRLRELRERAGLTQVQLAEKAGLHPQGVIKLERGEREPAWGTVLALMDALGVSCQAFLEEPGPQPEVKLGRPRKADTAAPDPAQKGKAKRGRK